MKYSVFILLFNKHLFSWVQLLKTYHRAKNNNFNTNEAKDYGKDKIMKSCCQAFISMISHN